jgi:hypothetical protein
MKTSGDPWTSGSPDCVASPWRAAAPPPTDTFGLPPTRGPGAVVWALALPAAEASETARIRYDRSDPLQVGGDVL